MPAIHTKLRCPSPGVESMDLERAIEAEDPKEFAANASLPPDLLRFRSSGVASMQANAPLQSLQTVMEEQNQQLIFDEDCNDVEEMIELFTSSLTLLRELSEKGDKDVIQQAQESAALLKHKMGTVLKKVQEKEKVEEESVQEMASSNGVSLSWIEYSSTDYKGRKEYLGSTLDSNTPHGLGAMTWADGTSFYGEWFMGKVVPASSPLSISPQAHCHESLLSQRWGSQISGFGCEMYPSGSVFQGQFREDDRHGIGTFLGNQNVKYLGPWYKGERHGTGVVCKMSSHGTTWQVLCSFEKDSPQTKSRVPEDHPEVVRILQETHTVARHSQAMADSAKQITDEIRKKTEKAKQTKFLQIMNGHVQAWQKEQEQIVTDINQLVQEVRVESELVVEEIKTNRSLADEEERKQKLREEEAAKERARAEAARAKSLEFVQGMNTKIGDLTSFLVSAVSEVGQIVEEIERESQEVVEQIKNVNDLADEAERKRKLDEHAAAEAKARAEAEEKRLKEEAAMAQAKVEAEEKLAKEEAEREALRAREKAELEEKQRIAETREREEAKAKAEAEAKAREEQQKKMLEQKQEEEAKARADAIAREEHRKKMLAEQEEQEAAAKLQAEAWAKEKERKIAEAAKAKEKAEADLAKAEEEKARNAEKLKTEVEPSAEEQDEAVENLSKPPTRAVRYQTKRSREALRPKPVDLPMSSKLLRLKSDKLLASPLMRKPSRPKMTSPNPTSPSIEWDDDFAVRKPSVKERNAVRALLHDRMGSPSLSTPGDGNSNQRSWRKKPENERASQSPVTAFFPSFRQAANGAMRQGSKNKDDEAQQSSSVKPKSPSRMKARAVHDQAIDQRSTTETVATTKHL